MSKQPYNPKAEIDRYNEIVKKRGFDFFSSKGVEDHKKKYGDKSFGDAREEADKECKAFMDAVEDINHVDHPKCYARFKSEFKSSKNEVKAHFQNEALKKYGLTDELRPVRSAKYEKHVL